MENLTLGQITAAAQECGMTAQEWADLFGMTLPVAPAAPAPEPAPVAPAAPAPAPEPVAPAAPEPEPEPAPAAPAPLIDPNVLGGAFKVPRVSVHMWRGKRKDKTARAAAAEGTGANPEHVAAYRMLISDQNPAYRAIKSAGEKVAKIQEELTAPWEAGYRAMQPEFLPKYTARMAQAVAAFDAAADQFREVYEAARLDAAVTMGALYRPEDWPLWDNVRRRFWIEQGCESYFTVQDKARDFRLRIGEWEFAAEKEQQARAEAERLVAEARGDVLERILEKVENMANRLSAEGGFHDSLCGHIDELIATAEGLNPLGDPVVAATLARLKSLAGIEPDSIKPPDVKKHNRTAPFDEGLRDRTRDDAKAQAEEIKRALDGVRALRTEEW